MKKNTLLGILVAMGVPLLFFMLFEGGRGLPTKPKLPHFHQLSPTDTQANKIIIKDTIWHTIGQYSWEGYHNRPITSQTFNDKVYIASFLSTKQQASEAIMQAYTIIQEKFKDRFDVQLLNCTLTPQIDPIRDLRQYADRYEADSSRWLFARTDSMSMYQTAVQQFKVDTNINVLLKNPPIVLIDKNQTIRGQYHSQDQDFPRRLISDLMVLMLEYPEERPTVQRKPQPYKQ